MVDPRNITTGCWELNVNVSLYAQLNKHTPLDNVRLTITCGCKYIQLTCTWFDFHPLLNCILFIYMICLPMWKEREVKECRCVLSKGVGEQKSKLSTAEALIHKSSLRV